MAMAAGVAGGCCRLAAGARAHGADGAICMSRSKAHSAHMHKPLKKKRNTCIRKRKIILTLALVFSLHFSFDIFLLKRVYVDLI